MRSLEAGDWSLMKGLADNHKTFRALVARGVLPEEAALQTFTGKMAARAGFGKVRIIYDHDYEVWVEFTR